MILVCLHYEARWSHLRVGGAPFGDDYFFLTADDIELNKRLEFYKAFKTAEENFAARGEQIGRVFVMAGFAGTVSDLDNAKTTKALFWDAATATEALTDRATIERGVAMINEVLPEAPVPDALSEGLEVWG